LKEEDYICLYLFLSTKFSSNQLIRSSSHSVQPHLTITLVKNISLFKYSNQFKFTVSQSYKKSIELTEQSQTLYRQAEELLLSTIGLKDTSSLDGCYDSGGVVASPQGEVVQKRYTQNYKSLPYNPQLKERVKVLRKAGMLHEVLVWNLLKKGGINGLDFDRQKIIGNYIVDFYCAEKNTVIEIDGSSHDDKGEYDARRDEFLKNLGLEVLHITAKDVLQRFEDVERYLRGFFTTPPFGHPSEGGEFSSTASLSITTPPLSRHHSKGGEFTEGGKFTTTANYNIKSFKESFSTTGRLDAEYYQPKYEEYIQLIKRYLGGYDLLQTVCNLKDTNFMPEDTKEYQYIELSDIGKSGNIIGCTLAQGCELPSRARRKINTNDVIISSIEGSLGSCALITEDFDNALCSTGFYVINSRHINSETLLVLFKSEVMQNTLKQNCSGTILTAINKTEFQNIPIPIIDLKTQQQISALIQESFALRKESERLLDEAKDMVEREIERKL
jgi:very-short-patch-repair endonuclease